MSLNRSPPATWRSWAVILTSITPFGQTGPYRDYKTCDLVSMALGGYVYLTGDSDRPPVRIGFPQAYLHAGMAAAAGTMVAHYHRQLTGEGQWVDVSIQEACAWIPTDSAIYWEMNQVLEERHGGVRVRPTTGAHMKRIWQCRDGYVSFDMYGARLARNFMTPLVAWMAEEGAAPKEIIATKFKSGANPASGVLRTRPLCPYPTHTEYKGQGDPQDAKNFECKQ